MKVINHIGVFLSCMPVSFLNTPLGRKLLIAPVSIFAFTNICPYLLPIFNLAYASVALDGKFWTEWK